MPIDLPINVEFVRPLTPPESPYRLCGLCQFVGIEGAPHSTCPGCGGPSPTILWPDVDLKELWNDVVFCWNHEKAELATVSALFFFEAATYKMIYWGNAWLDPDRNWIGATAVDLREKNHQIEKHLARLKSWKQTNAELKRLFGEDAKEMLKKVAGEDATPFFDHYMRGREWRNAIAHRGRRGYYETISWTGKQRQWIQREEMLRASVEFVPQCWVVFSRLWNEYIHKRMRAKM